MGDGEDPGRLGRMRGIAQASDHQLVRGDAEGVCEAKDRRGARVRRSATLLDVAEIAAVEADLLRELDLAELPLLAKPHDPAAELGGGEGLGGLGHVG